MRSCENFPEHWHTPIEMIRCVEAWYRIVVGGEDYILREGDIAVIRPGAIHALFAPEQGSRVICLADISFLRKVACLETLLALLPPVSLISAERNELLHKKVTELLLEIEQEYAASGSFFELRIYGALIELLTLLGRSGQSIAIPEKSGDAEASKYAARLLQICGYINDHCTEDLTLEQVANLAGFSKYYFERVFRQFTHTTFYKYLNKKRIAHAEQLLINPDYTVTEAALRSGFSSQSAFIRMFRQITGCTPTEFRNMYSPNCAVYGQDK